MVVLNSTSSIVDFLKSQQKDSSFTARKSLYETSGLKDRLGDYVGSASQNTAFLKQLSTPAQTGAVPIPTPTPPTSPPKDPITPSPTPTPTPTPTIGTSGITASQAASSIPTLPSADEILQNVLSSSGFQNFQQSQQLGKTLETGEAEAQKAKLETQTAADTKAFVDSMRRRGLSFSGEAETGLQALAESLASSKLNIDRSLAGQLLQSDLKTKQEIINQVGQVVKDAQGDNKEAIRRLEEVGLTIVGDQVVPTLAAQSAARAEENQKLAIQREERLAQSTAFNQEATLARLELSEEAASRAERSLARIEANAAGGGTITSGSLTLSKDSIGKAANELNAKRGADWWTDPYMYLQAYQQWTNQGGLPQDFTKTFPPKLYVNPAASSVPGLLPDFLQNKPSNNVLIFNPASVQAALDEGE